MNAAQFSSALGKVNDKYIMEAITCERKKKIGWLKWGAAAACLCLVIVGAITTVHERRTSPSVYGVLAEVTEILSEHQFEAIVTGEDVNFFENEAVTVTCEDAGEIAIAIGDTVAITYSEFEKSELSYKISAGQIEIVSLIDFPDKGSAPPNTRTPPSSRASTWMNRLNLLSRKIHDGPPTLPILTFAGIPDMKKENIGRFSHFCPVCGGVNGAVKPAEVPAWGRCTIKPYFLKVFADSN